MLRTGTEDMKHETMLKEVFSGIYSLRGLILTKNLVPGKKVYGEDLIAISGAEYRKWVPSRSKLCAAIKNGLKDVPLKEGSVVLYLGSSEGTTASHISDIVGGKGVVFGVEFSERSMRKFIYLCEQRSNLVPILADANMPESYAEYLKGIKADLLYQDIAQKNQAEIFLKNAKLYLQKGKYGMLVIKAMSIDSGGRAGDIYRKEIEALEKEFKVLQVVDLKPFDKEHVLVFCRKK